MRVPVPATRALAALLTVGCGAGALAPAADAAGPLVEACRRLDPDVGSDGFLTEHVSVSAASPWRATRRSRARYVAMADTPAGRRLTVCAERGQGTAQALDLHARIARTDRLVRAAVADPWVAWVTRPRRATSGDIVRWQRLGGDSRAPAARRVKGRVVGLVPTVGGAVLVQTERDGRSRIEVLRRGRQARRVVLAGPGAAQARHGRLVRWTPTDAAVTVGRRDDRRREVLPIDPATAAVRRRCRVATARLGPRVDTTTLGVDLLAATSWTGGSLRSSESVERGIEICGPDAALTAAVLLTRDGSGHDDSEERGWADVGVVGGVVVVREERVNGSTGTSTVALTVRAVYVPGAEGRMQARHPTLAVAAPAAGAFVERGRLWVVDADGLRQVPVAGSLTGPTTALRVRERDVVVRSTAGDEVVPVRPLSADAFATAPFGTRVAQDLTVDDVCGYDLGSPPDRCRIPATPTP